MTTEAALLAAIAANPDDDLPRLVYADWLDENDRPVRAEFIRLQIEIAHKEILSRAVVDLHSHLWKRQQEILDDDSRELLGPLAALAVPGDYEFRRGFLHSVAVSLRDFLDSYQTYLGSLVPAPGVLIYNGIGLLDRLSDSPHVGLIWELSAARNDLFLDHGIGVTVAAELIALAPRLERLIRLDLEECRIGDAGTVELFGRQAFPALADLDLSFNDLTDAGVIDLLNTGLPQRLKRLVLGGNPIGDQAAVELADRLGQSTVLENLNLRMTNIGRAGQAAITQAFGSRADLF